MQQRARMGGLTCLRALEPVRGETLHNFLPLSRFSKKSEDGIAQGRSRNDSLAIFGGKLFFKIENQNESVSEMGCARDFTGFYNFQRTPFDGPKEGINNSLTKI